MALPTSTPTLENRKFVETDSGEVAVRISGASGGSALGVDISQINGEDAGLYNDSSIKAGRVYVVNEDLPLDISLEDTTNLAATTHYYPASTGGTMDAFKSLFLSGKLIDADDTISFVLQGTNDEDVSSADWVNVAMLDFNSTTPATYVASVSVTSGTETFAVGRSDFGFRRWRVAVTCVDATNTVVLKARLTK